MSTACASGTSHFADSAPLAVEEQWRRLADLVDAAATVDLTSTESRAVVVEQAASTEGAAIEIAEHAATTCGLTLLMGTPPPATTTTVPPPDTTAGARNDVGSNTGDRAT